jgi:hypothetical protein
MSWLLQTVRSDVGKVLVKGSRVSGEEMRPGYKLKISRLTFQPCGYPLLLAPVEELQLTVASLSCLNVADFDHAATENRSDVVQ